MIGGWLLKLVLGLALAAVLAFEAGSPLLTKAQLDDRAHNAGSAAWRDLRDHQDHERAIAAGFEAGGGDVEAVEVLPDGSIKVTMKTTAKSIFVRKYIKKLASYYEVEVTTVTP